MIASDNMLQAIGAGHKEHGILRNIEILAGKLAIALYRRQLRDTSIRQTHDLLRIMLLRIRRLMIPAHIIVQRSQARRRTMTDQYRLYRCQMHRTQQIGCTVHADICIDDHIQPALLDAFRNLIDSLKIAQHVILVLIAPVTYLLTHPIKVPPAHRHQEGLYMVFILIMIFDTVGHILAHRLITEIRGNIADSQLILRRSLTRQDRRAVGRIFHLHYPLQEIAISTQRLDIVPAQIRDLPERNHDTIHHDQQQAT